MRLSRTVLSAVILVLAIGICERPAVSQQKSDSTTKLKDGFDVNALDRNIDPCVDFYHYSCGTWLKQNPVPPDKAVFGRSSELADRNRAILQDILEKVSTPNQSRNSNDQRIGDYYASCMDEDAIEKKGTDVLRPELARIDALTGKDGLPSLLAHYSLNGTNAFFGFGVQQDAKDSTQQIAIVGQGGFGLPDRDFYFRDDAKSVETRRQYVLHVQNMLELFGEKPEEAAAHSQIAMRIETALAKGTQW